MLNLLEKLMYAFSGLVVLGSLTLYLWQGSDPRTVEIVPAATKVTRRPAAPPEAKARAPQKAEVPADDQMILDRLASEQNVRVAGKVLQREDYQVETETFTYLKREANWQPELDKAKSELLPGKDGRLTRLKLFDIEEGSLLKKFDLKDGDILEFIDGEQVDFTGNKMDHIQRWKAVRDKIENGGVVAITLTRGGQPMQLQFKLR